MLWFKPVHQCKWAVTGTTYTPPQHSMIESVKGAQPEFWEHEAACRRGEPHIYMRCSECGDIKSKTVPGKWERPDVFMEAVQGAINGR